MRNKEKKWISLLVIINNILIITSIIGIFIAFTLVSKQKLYDQNITDIRNSNRASSQISSELSLSHEFKFNDILQNRVPREKGRIGSRIFRKCWGCK